MGEIAQQVIGLERATTYIGLMKKDMRKKWDLERAIDSRNQFFLHLKDSDGKQNKKSYSVTKVANPELDFERKTTKSKHQIKSNAGLKQTSFRL